MNITIIGAGRVGKTLGRLFRTRPSTTINAVFNQSKESSEAAINFIGAGRCVSDFSALPPADLTLITSPDAIIVDIAYQLAEKTKIKAGSLFVHCCGALSSDILSPLKDKGAYVASIHPMRSFANPELAVDSFAGTYCAIEGDQEAMVRLVPFFEGIGAVTFRIAQDKKALYHAASVFASNYLVTLGQEAINCLREAEVDEPIATRIILSLMRSVFENLDSSQSPQEALTGPIQRADLTTIEAHLQALKNEEKKQLYSRLGEATIALTTHEQRVKEDIRLVLNGIARI